MSGAGKAELRAQVAAARRAMSDDAREAARAAVRRHVLDRWERERWPCLAAYVPLRTEPGSFELLSSLDAAGVRVLVPVTLPDRDLDWSRWPAIEPLGPDAIAGADAVIVPASAVARDGARLGRGGGSYDRALPRARPGAPRIALLFEDELVGTLPADPWDAPVTAVVRPSGWTDLPASGPDARPPVARPD